jgi:hypothetical protein
MNVLKAVILIHILNAYYFVFLYLTLVIFGGKVILNGQIFNDTMFSVLQNPCKRNMTDAREKPLVKNC